MVFVVYIVDMSLAHVPEIPEIQVSQAILAALPNAKTLDVQIGDKTYQLPEGLRGLLEQLLTQTAKGQASQVSVLEQELSSSEAAEFLRVSRQFLVNEADAGRIAYRKVGTHRRVRLEDALQYKEAQRKKSLEIMAELSKEAQELGYGY